MNLSDLFKRRFLILISSNLILSYFFFFIFWKYFGAYTTIQSQFNVIGTFFTIFGYLLTIYQISQIRDEKEMILDFQSSLNFDKFKEEVHDSCINTKNKLYGLIGQINTATDFNERNLQDFITILDEERNNILRINVKYKSHKDKFELPCDSCMTKLEECISNFEVIIENRQMDSINKTKHLNSLRKIISEIITMETKIRI